MQAERGVGPGRARHPLRWLHAASKLIQQGQCQSKACKLSGVASRRWKQRQATGELLLQNRPTGWMIKPQGGAQFWRILRWGGTGFAAAWFLAKL